MSANDGSLFGLSEKHLLALGGIAAAGAMLEQTLGSTIRAQMKTDSAISNVVVAGLSLQTLIDKVMMIARHQLSGTSVLTDLEPWSRNAKSAASARNSALHGVWISNPEPGTLESTGFPKKAIAGFIATSWTQDRLDGVILELSQATSELVGFWMRMGLIAGVGAEAPTLANGPL